MENRKTLFALGWLVPYALGQAALLAGRSKASLVVGILLVVSAAAVWLVVLYQLWEALRDGNARTTPGKAVGFLFIPIFNVYWIFEVWLGFARDYNKYVSQVGLAAKRLPAGLFLLDTLFIFLVPGAGQALARELRVFRFDDLLEAETAGPLVFLTVFATLHAVLMAKSLHAASSLPKR